MYLECEDTARACRKARAVLDKAQQLESFVTAWRKIAALTRDAPSCTLSDAAYAGGLDACADALDNLLKERP